MRICEYEFMNQDPFRPGYSMKEIDFYAFTNKHHDRMPSHALRLRRNLNTGEWELFRVFHRDVKELPTGQVIETYTGTGIREMVAYRSKNLRRILALGAQEWNLYHNHDDDPMQPDEPCDHAFCNARSPKRVSQYLDMMECPERARIIRSEERG